MEKAQEERYIDLHTHSSFSDGTLSPREVVSLAKEIGLAAMALTDHDTVDGINEARATGQELGIEIIEGAEIVAEYKNSEVHILGYFIDYKGDYLTGKFEELKKIRQNRNEKLVHRLAQIKLPVTMDELLIASQGKQITRMHFAKGMLAKGYVKTVGEAFDRYLAEGMPAYVGRNAFTFEECIEIIHTAGGKAVLAHPYAYKWQGAEVTQLIEALAGAGLDAIEAIYPLFDKQQVKKMRQTAQRLGLRITGGSDFHGENKPHIRLGMGNVPYEILEKLRG